MHEQLNLLRRLYDEPGAEGPPAGASPEFEALKAVKEALDSLPKQRPDPPVLDAVVAAASDAGLAAVRAVYGEAAGSAEGPEAVALRPVKEALDRLPKQRPDASVIDAIVAAAGEAVVSEAALAPLRAVYGEDAASLATPEAKAEAARFRAVKAGLDRLPKRGPEPATLDAVFAAAAAPASARAADRPARGGLARRRISGALGTALALVLVVAAGLWLTRDGAPEAPLVAEASAPAEREAERATAPPAAEGSLAPERAEAGPGAVSDEPLAVAAVPARERPAPAEARQRAEAAVPPAGADLRRVAAEIPRPAGAPTAVAAEPLPLTDGDDELPLLYLRLLEMQAAQDGLGWDAPPVSLGEDPAPAAPATSGWMQVRVER